MTPAERFDAFLHDHLLDWPDTEGRWLGETAAAGFRTAEEDVAPCPYAGRAGGMNAAALRQVNRHWPTVLDTLGAWSGPTAGAAWRATCRGRWAPLWHARPLPGPVAATFKTALGLHRPLTAWLLASPGAAAAPLHDLVAPDALPGRLLDEGWLHGQHLVCSAPPRQLVAAWQALARPTPAELHPADTAAVWVSGLWAVLGQTRELLRRGVLHEVPGWSPVASPHPDWPCVARWLGARGPGALVREVPRFDPAWSLRLWDVPPPPLVQLVEAATAATSLRALDEAWSAYAPC